MQEQMQQFEDLKPAKTMRVYACGGLGMNLGVMLSAYPNTEAGFSNLSVTYVDTSLSNLKEGVDAESVYVMKDMDGLGKIRREGAEQITKAALDILQRFKPLDVNVVLSSGSGGSGSVIAPNLVRHLLEKDQQVIVITVGSINTHLEAQNTLNTLKSYEGIAKVTEKPVVMKYLENSEVAPRKLVNQHIVDIINDLRVLYSGQNAELDSRDLYNWVRFERSTTHGAKLAALSLLGGAEIDVSRLGNLISVATVSSEEKDATLPGYVEYRCNGFVAGELSELLSAQDPLHFVVSDGPVTDIAKHLNQVLSEMESQRDARVMTDSLLDKGDRTEDNGMVY